MQSLEKVCSTNVYRISNSNHDYRVEYLAYTSVIQLQPAAPPNVFALLLYSNVLIVLCKLSPL